MHMHTHRETTSTTNPEIKQINKLKNTLDSLGNGSNMKIIFIKMKA